jgi:hypothetical protein
VRVLGEAAVGDLVLGPQTTSRWQKVANRMVRGWQMAMRSMDADGARPSMDDIAKAGIVSPHHHRLARGKVAVTVQDVRCARGMILLLLARRAVEERR